MNNEELHGKKIKKKLKLWHPKRKKLNFDIQKKKT